MKCPNCGLHNPEEAMRCDCGFDFENKTQMESFLIQNSKKASSALVIFAYVFAFCGGLIGIIISYSIAYGKNTNGFRYDDKSRKTARGIFIFSIIMTILWTIIRVTTI